MLRFSQTPQGVRTDVGQIAIYSVKTADRLLTQHIAYDNPLEFAADLNVIALPEKFVSLTFNYHHSEKGGTLLFDLVNTGDGEVSIFCSNNNNDKTFTYVIPNCQPKLEKLKELLITLNVKRSESDSYYDNLAITNQVKELLLAFASIVRSITRADLHNEFALNSVLNTFELENKKFQNMIDIHRSESAPSLR